MALTQVPNSMLSTGAPSWDASGNLTAGANLTLSGTAARITGDFTNTTVANRVLFQTSTANSGTIISAIPNGTGTSSQLAVYNNSDPANSTNLVISSLSADVRIGTNITGTGTPLPMTFYITGSERMRIDTSGIVTGTAGNLMLVQGTAQASTSGTSIDFTGIPSWAKRITVNFSGVSTNGSSIVQIQLGTSSGPTTTGYVSGAFSYNTGAGSSSTTGLVVDQSVAATNTRYGSIVISTLGSNIWVSQGILQMTTTGSITPSTGGITLGAVLDRVRITTVNGTDTFDAGTINIQYE